VGLIRADAASRLGCLHVFIGAEQEAAPGTNVKGRAFDLWRSEDPSGANSRLLKEHLISEVRPLPNGKISFPFPRPSPSNLQLHLRLQRHRCRRGNLQDAISLGMKTKSPKSQFYNCDERERERGREGEGERISVYMATVSDNI